jgi:hypothetical protein
MIVRANMVIRVYIQAATFACLCLGPAACGTGSDELPASLIGTWEGGNDSVSVVRFTDGGRIELNDGQCHGAFEISAIDENRADIATGYIECPPIMDGYITDAAVTVDGDTLTVDGPVINGTYSRR